MPHPLCAYHDDSQTRATTTRRVRTRFGFEDLPLCARCGGMFDVEEADKLPKRNPQTATAFARGFWQTWDS